MADQNFTIFSGDSKNLLVTVTDGNDNPVSLVGAQSIVWALIFQENIVLRKTLAAAQITITNGAAGQCTIALLAGDTVNLHGQYRHECRVVDVNGNSGIVFAGALTVNKAYI